MNPETIKKYQLNKRTWVEKGFHGVLNFFFIVGEQPLKTLQDWFGDCYEAVAFAFEKNYGYWYWCHEDMDRLKHKFVEKVNANPQHLQDLLAEWHDRVKALEKVMQKVDKTKLNILSNEDLAKLYQKWYNAYLYEYGIAIGIQDAFSMDDENFLIPHFKKKLQSKGIDGEFREYYLALISPIEDSFTVRELKDRFKILKSMNAGQDIKEELKEHAKKYYWIQNNYAKDNFLTAEFFKKQLEESKDKNPDQEIKRLTTSLKEIKDKKEQLIKELELDQKSVNLIRIIEVFAYMQDERKKYVLIASHYHKLFTEEFAKRLNLTYYDLEYSYVHEMLEFLKDPNKINKGIFAKRREFCLCLLNPNGWDLLIGKEAKNIFEKYFKVKASDVTEIKGQVASQGIARGPVKIVRTIHNLIGVNEGDILVASMTRPEMITAMKRAAAIVTDEGGVTSHAAVVSRELKIPCIIGTKIATKVLADGEIVEVDANKGIVRKL